ncbi:hypothetical protein PInf_002580 [Phytophthora infestans]|nr:hypothetical protein PInf_002580 [Phytophthora infestans]
MAAPQTTRPKPKRLKVPAFEGENLHFWVREVEIAMKAGLISVEPLRVAFSLSNLGGRAKHWAYTREMTSLDALHPGISSVNSFVPRSASARFLAYKRGKCELRECVVEMHTLVASLTGNPLPEVIKTTVLMDGLKVGPARTQLFRIHKQGGTPREEEHRHDEDGVPREAEHRSNDATAPKREAPASQPAGPSPGNGNPQ